METTNSILRPSSRQVGVALWAAVLTAAVCPASAAPGAAAPDAKPYTLYLGADLDVQQGKEFCRVQDVAGDNLVATVNGKIQSIPTTAGPVNLRVRRSLKLADTLVTIADLKSDRVYTPANDPVARFMRQQPGWTGQAQHDLAQGRATQYATNLGLVNPVTTPPAVYKEIQDTARAMQDEANQSLGQVTAPINNPTEYQIRMEQELAQKLFDAIEIAFDVSAPAPVAQPYVVIVAQYHDPGEAKGTAHNWIYAKALDPIDRTPRKVTIRKGGFPKGFELEGFQVHLYNRGRELGTTAADRQVALGRDEAFQYLLIEYLADHPGANVPATPALYRLPADLRERLSGAQFDQTFYVKVTKDGLPTAVYVDPSCLQKVDDPYLDSVIMDIRFNPALAKGQPTAGVALLKLSSLH